METFTSITLFSALQWFRTIFPGGRKLSPEEVPLRRIQGSFQGQNMYPEIASPIVR